MNRRIYLTIVGEVIDIYVFSAFNSMEVIKSQNVAF